jgi:serine protease Do
LKYWRDNKEHETTIAPAPDNKVVFDVENEKPEVAAEEKKPDAPTTDIKDFGLEVQSLTPDLAEQFGYAKDRKGLLISNVKDGSPADAAGIEAGFLITRAIKDKHVEGVGSVKDFQALAGNADDLAVYVETPKGLGRFVTLSKSRKE